MTFLVIIRTTIAALALVLSVATVVSAAGPRVLVAHRGVAGEIQVEYGFPENSIPAWRWAVKNGANVIDIDAQVARGGGFVVMHDSGRRGLDRTTSCTGSVQSKTLSQIRACWLELPVDANSNGDDDNTRSHPPSLKQALEFLRRKVDRQGRRIKITIEMKGPGWNQKNVNRLRDLLAAKNLLSQRVNVHSSKLEVVRYAKKAGIPNRGYLVSPDRPLPSAASVKKYADNILIRHTNATPRKVRAYNNAGIRVWLWTMDTTAEYRLASSKGKVYAWVVDDLRGARRSLRDQ